MHPIFFELGPLQFRYYGLMYAIGIMCAVRIMQREARRKNLVLSENDVMNFVMLSVFGGIVGGRLYYVAFNWPYYSRDVLEIFKIWHGGLAIHGGILGGTLVGWLLTRRWKLPFLKLADIAALCMILAQTFGRFGNFMNGDAHGVPTDMPWGIVFPPGSIAGSEFPGRALHPTMLYELVINLSIFLLLWNIRKMHWKDGFLCCLYLLFYSCGRFVVSFFRADSLMLGAFRMAHVISIVLILFAGICIVRWRLWQREVEA
ncbi:prolipoprotein diacylglyceryl transferase [candidate division KSB3 bacterium]|uniref:Phosphatidylglycerol--prolipoprotein diacylglyceryl transferase n=1 Tax=candidate division KSB3 bacterium TaxID=2044937 RepID=A0A2G6E869_9BACT|nr:MAG: prolipoprotein diacylglyceryl transferase [candidate division KSB3 bacterium]PIE30604.1 MAG: prolipoprotein diacylglyceryl transferase [candidate division KSB3 bacterium]